MVVRKVLVYSHISGGFSFGVARLAVSSHFRRKTVHCAVTVLVDSGCLRAPSARCDEQDQYTTSIKVAMSCILHNANVYAGVLYPAVV